MIVSLTIAKNDDENTCTWGLNCRIFTAVVQYSLISVSWLRRWRWTAAIRHQSSAVALETQRHPGKLRHGTPPQDFRHCCKQMPPDLAGWRRHIHSSKAGHRRLPPSSKREQTHLDEDFQWLCDEVARTNATSTTCRKSASLYCMYWSLLGIPLWRPLL